MFMNKNNALFKTLMHVGDRNKHIKITRLLNVVKFRRIGFFKAFTGKGCTRSKKKHCKKLLLHIFRGKSSQSFQTLESMRYKLELVQIIQFCIASSLRIPYF
jgi:hypothetical protein